MIIALYRLIALMIWFGVMFAVLTVVIAAALAVALLAVVYGLASPARTPASCLRSLAAHAREGIERIQALRPR